MNINVIALIVFVTALIAGLSYWTTRNRKNGGKLPSGDGGTGEDPIFPEDPVVPDQSKE